MDIIPVRCLLHGGLALQQLGKTDFARQLKNVVELGPAEIAIYEQNFIAGLLRGRK